MAVAPLNTFKPWIILGILAVLLQMSVTLAESQEQCRTCHEGIEEISASHPETIGCVVCHGGNGQTQDKDLAHASLIYDPASGTGKRNPSALKVVEQSCGRAQCHNGFEDTHRNQVDRMRKSPMGSLSGMIAGLRYQWGGQTQTQAKYGVYGVEDRDGDIPEDMGGVSGLSSLPYFSTRSLMESFEKGTSPHYGKISGHIGDKLLREKCFQCHLDSPPPPGVYRSQGCAACHFTYAPDGMYKGQGPTISHNEPGHPAVHQITALPPKGICTQCHRGYLAGPSTADFAHKSGDLKLFPGRGLPKQDVHFAAGMECIDCHTQSDIMGDGNIYSRQFQAVEIRCETCHGTSDSGPLIAEITDPQDSAVGISRHYPGFNNAVGDRLAVSTRKRKLSNVKVMDEHLVTLGKRTGQEHVVPLTNGESQSIHEFPGHKNKLACTACHSQWVPKCEGCHSLFSQNAPSGNQWGTTDFTLKLEEPELMVGPRGKVVPVLAQPSRTLTVLDSQGHPVPVINRQGDAIGEYRKWHFTNPMGRSGSRPVYGVAPHSVGKQVRTCASCHLSAKTLGLGEGQIVVGKSPSGKNDGVNTAYQTHRVKDISIEGPEAKVNLRGQPIAGAGQPGARPFNQEEITRILRVGNCIPCHNQYDDDIYEDMKASYQFERKVKHRHLRKKILNQR